MKGKNYYYSCVKPEESDAQAERFRALGARDGEIFIDTIGEKSSQRNSLRLLKQLALREGDTLTVSSLYCLSDLKKGLADELHWMRDNGIQMRIADIPLSVQEHDEKSQQFLSDLMFEVFDATILKEREQRRQKQTYAHADIVAEHTDAVGRGSLVFWEPFARHKTRSVQNEWLRNSKSNRCNQNCGKARTPDAAHHGANASEHDAKTNGLFEARFFKDGHGRHGKHDHTDHEDNG